MTIVASIFDPPVAGETFSLMCLAEDVVNSLDMPAELVWQQNGTLQSGNGLLVNNSVALESFSFRTIIFDDVRTSHGGVYYCESTFNSRALSMPYVTSINYTLIVAGKRYTNLSSMLLCCR